MIARPVSAIKRNKAMAPKIQAKSVSLTPTHPVQSVHQWSNQARVCLMSVAIGGAEIARRQPFPQEERLRGCAHSFGVRSQVRPQHEAPHPHGNCLLRLPQWRLQVSQPQLSFNRAMALDAIVVTAFPYLCVFRFVCFSKSMQIYDELIKRGD